MAIKLSEDQKEVDASSPTLLAIIMQQILKRDNRLGRSQEHFWIVGLNSQSKLLFIELLSLGRQNRVQVNPPDVFRMAIYKLATKAVLVHNHPSGVLKPSVSDRDLTDHLFKVGEFINIEIIDHIIISESDYFSFMEAGVIAEIRSSNTYRLQSREAKEMEALQKQIEIEQAQKNSSIEIARKLKAEGMDNEWIKKMTGLKLSEVKKL